jgi:alkylmercury lyase
MDTLYQAHTRRLEHLFDAELRYQPGMEVVVPAEGREGELIGSGGTVTGERLRGKIRRSMFSADCAYLLVKTGSTPSPGQHLCTTNPGGVIETDDGAQIRFDAKGYGLRGYDTSRPHLWHLTMALQFSTSDERYLWLNTTLGVWEGEFDENTAHAHYRAYAQVTPNRIEDLAEILESGFNQGTSPEGFALFRHLILLLAEGQPISPERIAGLLGRSREEMVAALRQLPSIEWDEAGNIVGAGLTLRPTPHRFEMNGRTVFTWCALDALMFPGLIGHTVQVESPCVTTGTPVRVTVTPQRVERVEPPEAVVSLVAPEASPDVRRAFCDYVNFFSSPEAAAEWLAAHPGATTLPVAEAYELGRRLANSVFQPEAESSRASEAVALASCGCGT